MDEKDYIMLQYIYQERNITKAAKRLFTTQPTLTYRLQQIEKNLGVQVLVRNGKSIEFTPEGEYLVSFARKMLSNIQNFNDHLSNMTSSVHGNLRIAVTSITARYYLPEVLKSFTNEYPNVKININTGKSPYVIDLLENEEVHVGIIRRDYSWTEGKYLISSEDICLISKDPISLSELPNIPQVYYRANQDESHKLVQPDDKYSLSLQIQNWWNERYSTPPLYTMEVGNYETCKEMVQNGLGYAIIPRLFIKPNDNLYTHKLVLKNGEALTRNTWLLYRKASLQLSYVKKFVNHMQSLNCPANQSLVNNNTIL
jgi:DNA-binding transcriptional LysR family regulator